MKTVFAFLFLISITQLDAQNNKQNNKPLYRLSIGGNGSNIGSEVGIIGGYNFTYQNKSNVISFSNNSIEDVFFSLQEKKPRNKVWDIGLLYGKAFLPNDKHTNSYFAILAGLGLTRGIYRGKFLYSDSDEDSWSDIYYYESKRISTLAVLLECHYFWLPSDNIGFGSILHININKDQPLYGLLFCCQVGMLK